MEIKKVKNILFKLELKGNGIVNYDSNKQKFLASKTNFLEVGDDNKKHNNKYNNNIMFAKKNYYIDNENKYNYRIKISSNALRYSILGSDDVENNPAIMQYENIFYRKITSLNKIIQGYLFNDKNKPAYKKSSALCISDAIQTNNSISHLEIFIKNSIKNSKSGDIDKSDNTLFYKENIGDITYESIGNICLDKLQFISCDQLFDRCAFNSDDFEIYKKYLKLNIPILNDIDLAYYGFQNKDNLPEYGILFSDDITLYLVKHLLKKMLSLSIYKANAYAIINKLKIKLVYDPLIDTFDNYNGWIDINSENDINNLNFEIYQFYHLIDENSNIVIERKKLENEIKETQQIETKKNEKRYE